MQKSKSQNPKSVSVRKHHERTYLQKDWIERVEKSALILRGSTLLEILKDTPGVNFEDKTLLRGRQKQYLSKEMCRRISQALGITLPTFIYWFGEDDSEIDMANNAVWFEEYVKRWDSEYMLKARKKTSEEWMKWLNNKNNTTSEYFPMDTAAEFIAEFMEELGECIPQMRGIMLAKVWSKFSWQLDSYYFMFKECLNKMRIEACDDTLYESAKHLSEMFNSNSKARDAGHVNLGENVVKEFAIEEIERTKFLLNCK